MKQVYFLIAVAYLLVSLTACSQTKSLIKRTDAFYVVRLPGTVPVNEDGHQTRPQADTTNFVYIETASQNITWKEAIIEGRTYDIVSEQLERGSIDIGYDRTSQQTIRIKAADANYLWRLTFKPKQSMYAIQNHPILIKAEVERKSISIPITLRKEIILPEVNQ